MVNNSLYLQHSSKPQNMGILKDPTNIAEIKFDDNKKEASVLVYCLLVGNKIKEIKFSAKASIPVLACLSYLTSQLRDQSVSKAFDITPADLVLALALPKQFHYCAQRALEAVQKALKEGDDPFDKAFKTLSAYNGPYKQNQPYAFED